MIFGGIVILLFSVSATLKVCIIIIARKKLMSSILFKLIFTKLNIRQIWRDDCASDGVSNFMLYNKKGY